MTKKVSKESLNISEEKIAELKKVIPEVFTEEKIDFEKLERTLGKEIDGKDEKYSFNWAGRKETFKNIQTTAKGTLKPVEKESVNFDKTENLFIEGDNLEVLKLLQKAYFNKIKMIYIDPPYNTGKDFVYKDNFKNSIQSYLEQTGQLNGDGVKLTTNPETNGRFHSDWISMIYPRLFVARNLLKEDGVIFVSIDDNEVTNLRKVMDEVFGEENFVACVVWKRKRGRDNSAKWFSKSHEYLLIYSKNKEQFNTSFLDLDETTKKAYKNPDNDSRGDYRMLAVWARGTQGGCKYSFTTKEGTEFASRLWLMSKENLKKLDKENKLIIRGNNIYRKLFIYENKGKIPETIWDNVSNAANASDEIKRLFGKIVFDTPKPIPYIQECLKIATSSNDIILDFFAGSGTTAHSVLDLNKEDNGNRKFILVQIPEKTDKKSEAYKQGYKTISEIGKERIRRVIKQIEKEQKEKSKQKKLTEEKKVNLDLGFKVFKLDKSNYKIWEKYEGKDAKELKKQLELFKTPLISGYKNEDVIYECMIKEGYSLNSKIEKTEIKSNNIYKVIDGDLFFYISLDSEIKNKTINELKLKKENIFICLDEALNDSKKKNLSIQCNLKVI